SPHSRETWTSSLDGDLAGGACAPAFDRRRSILESSISTFDFSNEDYMAVIFICAHPSTMPNASGKATEYDATELDGPVFSAFGGTVCYEASDTLNIE
ncbi:hypothetical protein EJB05_36686, partial [Eragrostis curvula]